MLLAVVTLASIDKIVTFLVMLSILIVLHEYGHFIVARRNGVRVNEFAIGMGPKLFGWVSPGSGTLYSLRALPIGGYCAMEGEDNKTTEAVQQREFRALPSRSSQNFQSKSPWSRLAIILAGPAANFVLAYIILLVGALAFGIPSDRIDRAIVTVVMPGYPAATHGLRPGDRIVGVSVGGKDVTDANRLVDTIHGALGKTIDVTYEQDGVSKTIHVQPKPCPQNAKQGCIGFSPAPAYERVGLLTSLRYAGWNTWGLLTRRSPRWAYWLRSLPSTLGRSQARSAWRRSPAWCRISAGAHTSRWRQRFHLRLGFSTCCPYRHSTADARRSSSPNCCAANRSIRIRKRSCISPGSQR